MTIDDFMAIIQGHAFVPSRIEAAGFSCRAYCGACGWRGPQHGGDPNAAHEQAKSDLVRHCIDATGGAA